jgi:hypothetical protein
VTLRPAKLYHHAQKEKQFDSFLFLTSTANQLH